MSGTPMRKQSRKESGNDAPARDYDAVADAAAPSDEAATLHAVLALLETDFQCAICQGMVVAPHLLPCSHRFCGVCILEWLKRKGSCPTCRATTQGPPALERGMVRLAWSVKTPATLTNYRAEHVPARRTN